MEIVWHGKFNELFATFPHLWTLKPTDTQPQQATAFNDSAKVRFLCKVTTRHFRVEIIAVARSSFGESSGPFPTRVTYCFILFPETLLRRLSTDIFETSNTVAR